jgi:UDP-3-O-[3-hydroxymyristoyl] glucosamine N-acyltransferase
MLNVTAEEIAKFLNNTLHGKNSIINKVSDIEECGPGDLIWCRSYTPERVNIINRCQPALVICPEDTVPFMKVPYICSSNPKLDFVRILSFYLEWDKPVGIHETAIIYPGAKIGKDAIIGPYSIIGPQVEIGNGCQIGSHVSIEGIVKIGNRFSIKSSSSIGGQGFSFVRDEQGVPLHFPHIGKIIIGDDVWMGSSTTIERGGLGNTTICDNVKIDDLVQLGHNITVGKNTCIAAGVIICGGSVIGQGCWIAPRSVLNDHIYIGHNVLVGLGSVVMKNVQDNSVVVGVPAKKLDSPNLADVKMYVGI